MTSLPSATSVGRVLEIWRFPVKSMQGERIDQATVLTRGLLGDRDWALIDGSNDEITGAKRLPALLSFEARHLSDPAEGATTPVEIHLPDGTTVTSEDLDATSRRISEQLGKPVRLCPRRPASDRAHYRKRHRVSAADTREVLGLEPDEPFPDLSTLPLGTIANLVRYATPPGSYVDACPLHLLSTASLAAMHDHAPESAFDVRRFRPNFLLETDPALDGLPEESWVGARLFIGSTVIRILSRTVRCSMPAHEQPGLAKDPLVTRTVSRQNQRHLGVYASVEKQGTISVGDEVRIKDGDRSMLAVGAWRAGNKLKRVALTTARKILR